MSAIFLIFGPMFLAGTMMLLGKKESAAAKYIALVLFLVMLFASSALLAALPAEGYMIWRSQGSILYSRCRWTVSVW